MFDPTVKTAHIYAVGSSNQLSDLGITFRGLKYELRLQLECRVMLTLNLSVDKGLTNGAKGRVYNILYYDVEEKLKFKKSSRKILKKKGKKKNFLETVRNLHFI